MKKLSHEKRISVSQLAHMCPQAHAAAGKEGLKVFWVNDLKECFGDPVTFSQDGKEFSLAGSSSWDDQARLWDPSRGTWLTVV